MVSAFVEAVYTKHNAAKLSDDAGFVQKTMKRYEGKEKLLVRRLMKKYGVADRGSLALSMSDFTRSVMTGNGGDAGADPAGDEL